MKVSILFASLFSLSTVSAQTIQYNYDKAGRHIQSAYSNKTSRNYVFDKDGNRISLFDTTCKQPVANFASSKTTGNCPLSIDFYDNSTVTGASQYEWTFYLDSSGTTVKSTNKNPVGILYNKPGTFMVKLKVSDYCDSNIKTVATYITVICPCNPPVLKFGASNTSGHCPFPVNFFDSSTVSGSSVKYKWTFYVDSVGTTITDTSKNPTGIVYNKAGSFAVKLQIVDSCQTDSINIPGYINVTCPTGIPITHKDNNISVYPNPTEDLVTVEGKDLLNGRYTLELINVIGQILQKQEVLVENKLLREQISLKKLPSGVYYVKVATEFESQTFIITKR